MFENFSLSTNISAGCEEITNLMNEAQACGFLPPRWTGGVIFNDEAYGNCESVPTDKYDSLCYHVPSDSYNLFTS